MDAMVNAAPNSPLPSSPRARGAAATSLPLKTSHVIDPSPPSTTPAAAPATATGPAATGLQLQQLTVPSNGTPVGLSDNTTSTTTTTHNGKLLVPTLNSKADEHHQARSCPAMAGPGGAAVDLEAAQYGSNGGGNFVGVGWAGAIIDDAAEHWHYSHRSPWLRALVLGANDGLVSISALMLGVGAVKNDVKAMVISGLAGLVAGAGSMAIGEFVSVFSQRDTELADIEKERQEHAKGPAAEARELEELTQIYVGRGLPYYLAKQVAEELSKVDVLKAHARDELGIDVDALSNPLQAATASALAFSLGGGLPLLAGAFVANYKIRVVVVVAVSSIALAMFGAAGARLGGAPMIKAALRVLLGGWLAMSLTYGILRLLGISGI